MYYELYVSTTLLFFKHYVLIRHVGNQIGRYSIHVEETGTIVSLRGNGKKYLYPVKDTCIIVSDVEFPMRFQQSRL